MNEKTLKTGDLNENKGENTQNITALTEMVLQLQKQLNEMKIANTQVSPGNNIEMIKMLAEFNAANEKAKELDFQGGIRQEDIPLEDYDEEGVVFCAPYTGYAIADDMRMGHRVVLPYNKPFIVFNLHNSKPIQEGKHVKLMNFAIYKSHSKKEAEWLRNFTFFNAYIYESTRGAMNFDVMKAQKLAKIMTTLARFEMPQLIARCKEYAIPINEEISVMRSMLAMKMADRELESDQNSTQRRLAELEKEKSLLMQTAN